MIGLYIDDERELPMQYQDWMVARSFHRAILLLEQYEFDTISIDHDLASFYGNTEMTGYHIVQWLAQRKHDGMYVPSNCLVHSMNPVGKANMISVIERYLS